MDITKKDAEEISLMLREITAKVDLMNDSVTISLNKVADDMFDFMDEHGHCDSFEPEEKCLNPNCQGFFSHSQVGLAGGDLPSGFEEK